MSSPSEIAAQLVEIVSSAPHQKVLGTRLADHLRIRTDFDPHIHGRLGLFIARHAPSVTRLERKGGDWYYGLTKSAAHQDVLPFIETQKESLPQSHGMLERLTGPVWKTFASPSTRHHLMGNSQTGMLTVIPPGRAIPQAPWISVPPCLVSEHAAIAKAFVVQLDDPVRRSALEEILERAGSGPASGFYEKIRDLGLGSAWSPFRRRKLLEVMNSTLKELGIEFSGVMDLDKQNLRIDTPTQSHRTAQAEVATSEGIDIQKIAAAAVARMSDSELRNLPIPLGYILDALVNR